MICPKCGFEQPDSPECARCGVIVSRYKGPLLGTDALRPPVTPAAPAAVAPMAAGGGTIYDGPLPVAAGGGTVYGGPPPIPRPPGGAVSAPAFGRDRSDFGVGNVLSQTFSVYFSNFLPFALLAALALVPVYLLEVYTTAVVTTQARPSLTIFSPILLIAVVSVVCRYFATAVITYGVFQQMRGVDTSIGDCLGQGLSSLLPILGLAVVQGIAIWFGLIACIVPGLLMALRWAVSIPAAVTERVGITEAMNRSAFLTDGMRGDVFGVLFVLGILEIGITLLVTLVAARNHALHMVLTDLNAMLSVGLSATASAVLYYRLRDLKESIDVDQVAAVFA